MVVYTVVHIGIRREVSDGHTCTTKRIHVMFTKKKRTRSKHRVGRLTQRRRRVEQTRLVRLSNAPVTPHVSDQLISAQFQRCHRRHLGQQTFNAQPTGTGTFSVFSAVGDWRARKEKNVIILLGT